MLSVQPQLVMKKSPVWHIFEDLVTAISDSDMPLFVFWVTLGVDINNGMTSTRSKMLFYHLAQRR